MFLLYIILFPSWIFYSNVFKCILQQPKLLTKATSDYIKIAQYIITQLNDNLHFSTQGEKGDAGPEGAKGDRGEIGMKGTEGPLGPPGLVGVRVSVRVSKLQISFKSHEKTALCVHCQPVSIFFY